MSAADSAALASVWSPYRDGYRAGATDRRIGVRSSYAWNCIEDLNTYASKYSAGYRDGWNGQRDQSRGKD